MRSTAVDALGCCRVTDERRHIAVGVILDRGRERVLLALRPDHVHLGGLWEFPGGKCRPGEDVRTALKRELFEELNLIVDACRPLVTIEHDYTEQAVFLDVWCVDDWHGNVHGREGQTLEWAPLSQLSRRPLPEANGRIIEVLGREYDGFEAPGPGSTDS